ncbi:MAG: restriction endonuclease subunit S [bacterium]|nr:restriction endonuclease subunit S [bacterium]
MSDSHFSTVTLRDVLMTVETGSRPQGGSDQSMHGIPSLGGENIRSDGSLDLHNIRRIPEQFYLKMSSGHLHSDDVLINKDGAQTGKIAIYKGEFEQAAINEHCFLLRGGPVIDQNYLYYCLLSQDVQRKIILQITGSAQPGLNQRFFDYVHIPLPPIEEQRRIAEVLDSVDETIQAAKRERDKLVQLRAGLAADLLSGRVRTVVG